MNHRSLLAASCIVVWVVSTALASAARAEGPVTLGAYGVLGAGGRARWSSPPGGTLPRDPVIQQNILNGQLSPTLGVGLRLMVNIHPHLSLGSSFEYAALQHHGSNAAGVFDFGVRLEVHTRPPELGDTTAAVYLALPLGMSVGRVMPWAPRAHARGWSAGALAGLTFAASARLRVFVECGWRVRQLFTHNTRGTTAKGDHVLTNQFVLHLGVSTR